MRDRAEQPHHPLEDYQQAPALFRDGCRDEAVYWFYRGQLRARTYLLAHPDAPPDEAPALDGSLDEVIGRPIAEWAFGS